MISYKGTLIKPLIRSDFPTEREKPGPLVLNVITKVERNIAGKEPKIPPRSGPPILPIKIANAMIPPPKRARQISWEGG